LKKEKTLSCRYAVGKSLALFFRISALCFFAKFVHASLSIENEGCAVNAVSETSKAAPEEVSPLVTGFRWMNLIK